MQIADTHQHLWDIQRFRYSWLDSVPRLNRSFHLEDYVQATSSAEVLKTIHIECDVDERFMLEETRYVLRLAEQENSRIAGVVASARPESRDFDSYLREISRSPRVKGVRRVLHTQPDNLGYETRFVENVASLGSYGLSFDLCVLGRQLPVAIHLASSCPNVTFILDHCGVPQVRERILEPWRTQIAELSSRSNVFCKVSGLMAYADPERWVEDDLRPYIEHVIACFGWDRVLFGSDWPVCTLTASFQQWVDTLDVITRDAGQANQQKLFHDNACRVYRLE